MIVKFPMTGPGRNFHIAGHFDNSKGLSEDDIDHSIAALAGTLERSLPPYHIKVLATELTAMSDKYDKLCKHGHTPLDALNHLQKMANELLDKGDKFIDY